MTALPESFSLSPERCFRTTPQALREELQQRTGNLDATNRILSSIARFGSDPSILRFDLSPVAPGYFTRLTNPVAWTVRAVRAEPPRPPEVM